MRYDSKKALRLDNERYQEWFDNLGVKFVNLYPTFPIKYPNADKMRNIKLVTHIWKSGDSLSNLAENFYKHWKYWEVIAIFNMRPTDAFYRIGDKVYIPQPLEMALQILEL